MIKVIAFDCWNTLFYKDIKPRPFEEFANELGYNMQDYEYRKVFEECFMLKNNSNYIKPVEKILKTLGLSKTQLEKEKLVKILNKNKLPSKAYKEVFEVLNQLIKQNYTLVIVSNAESIGFKSLESEYPLDKYFSHIIKSCDVGSIKPNPEIFKKLMELTNVSKEEVVMIGDSMQDDVLGAENFGIKGILIDRSKKSKSECKNKISSLKELNQYL